MNKLATTKLSSRGQIAIPEEIREQMHLKTGDQFIVIACEALLMSLRVPKAQGLHNEKDAG